MEYQLSIIYKIIINLFYILKIYNPLSEKSSKIIKIIISKMGTTSLKESIINALKSDNLDKIKTIDSRRPFVKDEEISKNRTAIVLCSYFDAKNCLAYFISKGYDVNIPDKEDNSTPLIIASKFGYTNIIKELLANGCTTDNVNAYGLNAIDIAVIRGNYDTCMLLVNSTDLKPEKTLENYKALNQTLNYPLFNMDLFYQCLSDRIPVEEVPSFAPERKRRKQFEGKVPDPNETWTNFAKRLYRLELYQPPLVDASSVQNKNSLYMRMQTTFCEMEYGIKSKFYFLL